MPSIPSGEEVFAEVSRLYSAERLLCCGALLRRQEALHLRAKLPPPVPCSPASAALFRAVKRRYTYVLDCLPRLLGSVPTGPDPNNPDPWVLAVDEPGKKKVWYKHSRQNRGNILLKANAVFTKCKPVHFLAHGKEIHTAATWMPFCRSSSKVLDESTSSSLSAVAYAVLGVPLVSRRDVLVQFFSVDTLGDSPGGDGAYTLVAHSVGEEGQGPDALFGWPADGRPDGAAQGQGAAPPKRLGGCSCTVLYSLVRLVSSGPGELSVKFAAEIDPHLDYIPEAVLGFVLRQVLGRAIDAVESSCQRLARDPASCPLGLGMLANPAWYSAMGGKFDAAAAAAEGRRGEGGDAGATAAAVVEATGVGKVRCSRDGKLFAWAKKTVLNNGITGMVSRSKYRYFQYDISKRNLKYFRNDTDRTPIDTLQVTSACTRGPTTVEVSFRGKPSAMLAFDERSTAESWVEVIDKFKHDA